MNWMFLLSNLSLSSISQNSETSVTYLVCDIFDLWPNFPHRLLRHSLLILLKPAFNSKFSMSMFKLFLILSLKFASSS